MNPFRYLWLLIFLLLPRLAYATATATPLTSSEKAWVTLSLSNLPSATAEISLQDARGGMSIVRKISPAGPAVILSLPLISPAELANSQWPITLTARDAAGTQLESTTITATLKSLPAFRIALPQGASPQAAASLWPTARAIEWIELPSEEITSAPAQAFAGFDALYIPASLAGQLDEPRLFALLAAGTQVAIAGDTPPLPLSQLLWKRMNSRSDPASAATPPPAWLCTSITPPGPLINPDLAQLRLSPSQLAGGITLTLLFLGPIALFIAISLRVLFRPPLVIFALTTFALTLLAAITILVLRHADSTRASAPLAQWHTLYANQNAATGGIDVQTTLTASPTLFGRDVQFTAPCAIPLVATPRAWWQLTTATLALDSATNQFCVRLAPRQQLLIQTQQPQTAPLVPAFPNTPGERRHFIEQLCPTATTSAWIINGYAFPATAATFESGGTPFSAWSREQSAYRPSLDAWYTLRFSANNRYWVWLDLQGPHIVEFPNP